jgi:oxygen-independent coproporphyrinogen-3 oxidase
MAGLYLHVPFCKQACYYCDFHFSVNAQRQHDMVEAMCRELRLQAGYLGGETLETVYFGGGTPSLLTPAQLEQLLAQARALHPIAPEAEITLEANPDDLSPNALEQWRGAGINRLSIGIQSFHDPHLRFMNRAHSASEAARCVAEAQAAGFANISIDLIYGIPAPDHRVWKADLAQALGLGVQHLSAYCLTIEPDTVFGRWAKQGKLPPIDDDFAAVQFEMLLQALDVAGFEQYEISNACLPGFESRHNSSYWRGVPYLGIGPSAHSFNGHSRQWNVAHNQRYIKALEQDELPFEEEHLDREAQINDYLLTSLRTKWGTDLGHLRRRWGFDLERERAQALRQCLEAGHAERLGDVLRLTRAGKLLADHITAQLMA